MLWQFIIFSVVTVAVIKIWNFFKSTKREDDNPMKGPGLIEILRGVKAHKTEVYLLFTKWSQVFGKYFALSLGSMKVIVLNDYQSIREGYANPSLLGRPDLPVLNPLRKPRSGILNNSGPEWANQKKIVLAQLRRFGFGIGGVMEQFIIQEILEVIQHFDEDPQKVHHINHLFFFHIFSMIWIVLGGIRITNSENDARVREIFWNVIKCAEKVVANPFTILVPSLVYKFPWLFPVWTNYVKSSQNAIEYLRKLIQERKEQIVMDGADGQPTDFIYAYLQNNCLTAGSQNQFDPEAVHQLESILMDFILASYETTSTQLDWAVYHILMNDNVQHQIQEELDSVIGRHRLPNIADRSKLPYTEACILESFRLTPSIPVGVTHEATEDTTLFGHSVRKSDMIISNIYAAQHDPTVVSDPDTFQPGRFITVDEKTGNNLVIHQPYLLTFGSGRRMCAGDHLAKDTIFLLITTIFSKFSVSLVTGAESTKPKTSNMVLQSPDFYASFKRR